jgi:hypothetical protein
MLRLTFICPWSYRHPVIADLDVEHNELAQTWKTFVRHLPPSSRVERGDRPPSVDDVVALIRNTQSFWRSQPRHRVFGEASALCDKFVPTLNTHATLLAVLPDADLFHAPLFYSVLETVIKVGWTAPSLGHTRQGPAVVLITINSILGIVKLPSCHRGTHHCLT